MELNGDVETMENGSSPDIAENEEPVADNEKTLNVNPSGRSQDEIPEHVEIGITKAHQQSSF